MKKFTTAILTGLLMTALSFSSNAQAFESGASYISAGYGVGTGTASLFSVWTTETNAKTKAFGPIYFKYGYGVSDKVEFGLNVAYASNSLTYDNGLTGSSFNEIEISRTTWSALASLKLHFGDSDKFDPYWNVGLGYRTAKWTTEESNPDAATTTFTFKSLVPIGFETTFGARYLFSDNIGIYAELGIAKSYFQGGLTVKL